MRVVFRGITNFLQYDTRLECERQCDDIRRDALAARPLSRHEGRGLYLVTRDNEQHTPPVEKVKAAFSAAGIALTAVTDDLR